MNDGEVESEHVYQIDLARVAESESAEVGDDSDTVSVYDTEYAGELAAEANNHEVEAPPLDVANGG